MSGVPSVMCHQPRLDVQRVRKCQVTKEAVDFATKFKRNMAGVISLDFEGKTVGLTTTSLLRSTIARFFHVHEDGLHLKVSRNGKI